MRLEKMNWSQFFAVYTPVERTWRCDGWTSCYCCEASRGRRGIRRGIGWKTEKKRNASLWIALCIFPIIQNSIHRLSPRAFLRLGTWRFSCDPPPAPLSGQSPPGNLSLLRFVDFASGTFLNRSFDGRIIEPCTTQNTPTRNPALSSAQREPAGIYKITLRNWKVSNIPTLQ